jgi:hypothetical protein
MNMTTNATETEQPSLCRAGRFARNMTQHAQHEPPLSLREQLNLGRGWAVEFA